MIEDEIITNMSFDEVEIVDDATSELGIIEGIIKSKNDEDPFYIFDAGEVIKQHRQFISKMPRVEPFYALKCNSHPTVIKTLASLKTGFDCASKSEIEKVLAFGVSGERIIFAHTVKLNSHIRYAKEVGVRMLTADGEPELQKIKSIFPEAKVIIRFRCDANASLTSLGTKFGCDAVTEAPKLLRVARDLGLNIHGFSFMVGSQCGEIMAYVRGIKIAAGLIEHAESLGFQDVKLIDIGGGFPSADFMPIDRFAGPINEALEDVDPSIRVISEPGRYFVSSAGTLATFTLGKRVVREGDKNRYIYTANDSLFRSFSICTRGTELVLPIPLREPTCKETNQPTTILGLTPIFCDCIVKDCLLPELNVGDWLLWPHMGSYSFAAARVISCNPLPAVFPFARRKVWERNLFLQRSSFASKERSRSIVGEDSNSTTGLEEMAKHHS